MNTSSQRYSWYVLLCHLQGSSRFAVRALLFSLFKSKILRSGSVRFQESRYFTMPLDAAFTYCLSDVADCGGFKERIHIHPKVRFCLVVYLTVRVDAMFRNRVSYGAVRCFLHI